MGIFWFVTGSPLVIFFIIARNLKSVILTLIVLFFTIVYGVLSLWNSYESLTNEYIIYIKSLDSTEAVAYFGVSILLMPVLLPIGMIATGVLVWRLGALVRKLFAFWMKKEKNI